MNIHSQDRTLASVAAQIGVALIIVVVLCYLQPVALAALGSHGNDMLSQLVGSWESEDQLDGRPRVTVDVSMLDGKATGTVTIHGVQADNGADSLTLPIRDGKLQIGSLFFETDPGQDGITEWSLGMVSDSKALLSAVRDSFEIPKYVMHRSSAH